LDVGAFTKPSGRLFRTDGVVSFVPSALPPDLSYDTQMAKLLSEAHARLGRLSGMGILLPNPSLLVLPYLQREAVLSSKIEGTQVSLKDLMLYEARGRELGESHPSVQEVSNHVQALEISLKRVSQTKKKKPIDLQLICEAHRTLLEGVRGHERNPGRFRTIPNFIGPEGSKIEDARYVPPAPKYLDDLLMDLEGFIQHPPEDMPILIHCAIVHYQFEAIHPFGDGNGRLGRLLIPLLLCHSGELSQPLLYLSAYLEKHKVEYDERMLKVSQESDWDGWIKFFLKAVATQATEASENVQRILDLMKKFDRRLGKERVSSNVIRLSDLLFSRPLVTAGQVEKMLDVTPSGAQSIIDRLVGLGILRQITSGRYSRVYAASEILGVLA